MKMKKCDHRSADFPVCCIAGFPTRRTRGRSRPADLEIGDTAGLETCATTRKKWPRWLACALFAGVILLGATALAQDAVPAATAQDKADAAFRAIGYGVAAALAVGLQHSRRRLRRRANRLRGRGCAGGKTGTAAAHDSVHRAGRRTRGPRFRFRHDAAAKNLNA